MKTITEEYKLKKATFTVTVPTLESVDEAVLTLSAEHKLALIHNALAQWAYRKAAGAKNDGKAFTFQDAVTDMAAVRKSDGEPTKADIELADQRLVVVKSDVIKLEHVADHDAPEYADELQLAIEAIHEKNQKHYGVPIQWEWSEYVDSDGKDLSIAENAKLNLRQLYREVRLAKERKERKTNAVI